jgi:hypothetical protein
MLSVSVTVKLLLTHGAKHCLNGGCYPDDKVVSTTVVAPPYLNLALVNARYRRNTESQANRNGIITAVE